MVTTKPAVKQTLVMWWERSSVFINKTGNTTEGWSWALQKWTMLFLFSTPQDSPSTLLTVLFQPSVVSICTKNFQDAQVQMQEAQQIKFIYLSNNKQIQFVVFFEGEGQTKDWPIKGKQIQNTFFRAEHTSKVHRNSQGRNMERAFNNQQWYNNSTMCVLKYR